MKLKVRFERLRKAVPNRSTHGQMYNKKAETKKKFKAITLYTLFESEEGTHLLLPHVFETKGAARTAAEWSAYMSEKVSSVDGTLEGPPPHDMERLQYIHARRIIAGINVRTGKLWVVARILGWIGGRSRTTKRR